MLDEDSGKNEHEIRNFIDKNISDLNHFLDFFHDDKFRGRTVLDCVLGCGITPKFIQILLDKGVDVNRPNADYIFEALFGRFHLHSDIQILILEAGFDVTKKDSNGRNLLQFICERRYIDSKLKNKVLELIFSGGCELDENHISFVNLASEEKEYLRDKYCEYKGGDYIKG